MIFYMGFIEIKQEMTGSSIFQRPEAFFTWVHEKFQLIKNERDVTAKGFAFQLLDYVVNPEAERTWDPEKVFKGIISQAKTLGIEPWPNVIGLRPQASTCLADFLERE